MKSIFNLPTILIRFLFVSLKSMCLICIDFTITTVYFYYIFIVIINAFSLWICWWCLSWNLIYFVKWNILCFFQPCIKCYSGSKLAFRGYQVKKNSLNDMKMQTSLLAAISIVCTDSAIQPKKKHDPILADVLPNGSQALLIS